jgi:multidrug resistance efflux pump
MAIKFRRIEDRRESVVQLRHRREDARKRRRLIPKLFLLLLIAAAVFVYVFYFKPPRITAPFMVQVEPAVLASPVDGTVVALAGREKLVFEEGDEVARIRAGEYVNDSRIARRSDLRVQLEKASAELETAQADGAALLADLSDRELQMATEVTRLEEEKQRSEINARTALELLDGRAADFEDAGELRAVDAMTKYDYDVLERAYSVAARDEEMARSVVRGLDAQVAASQESLNRTREANEVRLAAAAARVEAAERTQGELQRALSLLPEEGQEFVVRAPSRGVVYEVDVTLNSNVQKGEPILSMYAEGSAVIRAYVPVRYRGEVTAGRAANLYLEGRGEPVPARVVAVYDKIVPQPSSLSRRVGYEEQNCVPVDLQPEPSAGAVFVPGDVGKAVIRR